MNLTKLSRFGSLSLTLALAACSGGGTIVEGTGGTGSTTGGANGNSGGASPGTGGRASGGGATVGGGASVGGGATVGGATGSGGAGNPAGGSASGGGPASGGSNAGGAPASGGATGSGGVTGSGGGGVAPGPSDLPAPSGASDVPKPSGTPGDVTVIDWAGFPAAVTYSFDDNDGSQLDHYDEMHAIGGRYTYYLVTSNFGTAISDARWKKMRDDGNEMGNHTTNHSCGASNIDGANTALQSTFGKPASTMAAPNGDDACQGQAKGRVFINRDVQPSTPVKPLDNSNPLGLNCYIPATGQATNTYNGNIDSALSQHGWVIYVVHGITPTQHTFQPVSWDGLKGAMEYSKSKNVWMDTMENVGSYWLGQKAFAAATSSSAGGGKTYTWTLPDKFPAGKYLRVKVDGGTLTQGGAALTWDPHGYYEIELDKKTLTVAP